MERILVFIFVTTLILVLTNKMLKRNANFKHFKVAKNIGTLYECIEGEFLIKGRKNYFTITKNKGIEFLIENGEIVAFRDKSKSSKFTYYGRE